MAGILTDTADVLHKMNIHVFPIESIYSSEFFKFLDKWFDTKNDVFIIRKRRDLFSYSGNIKILYIDNAFKLVFILLPKIVRYRNVHFHYLPTNISVIFWFFTLVFVKKMEWFLWGADIYSVINRPVNLYSRFISFFRRRLVRKINVIACPVDGDYEAVIKTYETKADYRHIIYPIPGVFAYLEESAKKTGTPGKTKKILIGNSATPTNQHIEVLENLSHLREEDIEIICPLIGEEEYGKMVKEYGMKVFGEKFKSFTCFLSLEEYMKMLADVDVAIMNHNRQQGLGNILPLLYYGKKVYMKDSISSFRYLKNLGVQVYNVNDIKEKDCSGLVHMDDTVRKRNHLIIKEELSLQNYLKLWKDIFLLKDRKPSIL